MCEDNDHVNVVFRTGSLGWSSAVGAMLVIPGLSKGRESKQTRGSKINKSKHKLRKVNTGKYTVLK